MNVVWLALSNGEGRRGYEAKKKDEEDGEGEEREEKYEGRCANQTMLVWFVDCACQLA